MESAERSSSPSEGLTGESSHTLDGHAPPSDASRVSKDKFPYRLEVLHDPKPRPANPVQIIFVHGLNGSKRGTWTHSKNAFWPEWLKDEKGLQNVRIATFGYNSSSNVLAPNTNLSIPIFADQLLLYLSQLNHRDGSVQTLYNRKLIVGGDGFCSA